MKHILITTIAAAVLVGCGETQQSSPPEAQPAEPASEAPVQLSSPPPEAKPVEPVEPVAKAAQPAQDAEAAKQEANRALMAAARDGNIEAIKQQLADGTDVNEKGGQFGWTPLVFAATGGHKETIELLIANGADVNAKDMYGLTPLDRASRKTADLLRKHGGKTEEELKAEGK